MVNCNPARQPATHDIQTMRDYVHEWLVEFRGEIQETIDARVEREVAYRLAPLEAAIRNLGRRVAALEARTETGNEVDTYPVTP